MDGMINIYKEKGYTSHDVVAKARGILRERKIGHTGTLDPEAEGVLPLCIGKATKIVPYLTDANKCYEAEVVLGTTTTTEDATGEVLVTRPVAVTKAQVQQVVESFLGDYTQVPPMYSAIKVNGVRLYELARAGKVIERPSREVKIYTCEIIEWIDEIRFSIRVKCSKGTYIRTLCTDIGEKLGCGAHMGALLRTMVDRYKLEDSITLGTLEANKENAHMYLHAMESYFESYPKVIAPATLQKAIVNGNPLPLQELSQESFCDGELIRVYDATEKWIGIYCIELAKKRAKVQTFFGM